MSEIRANTISDAAGTGPIDLHKQSAAKAWVNFNGGVGLAIRDSLNVASLTDNGVGDYTVNFSSSLVIGYYPTFSATIYNVAFPRTTGLSSNTAATVTSARFINGYSNPIGTGVAEDPDVVGMSAHGDLA